MSSARYECDDIFTGVVIFCTSWTVAAEFGANKCRKVRQNAVNGYKKRSVSKTWQDGHLTEEMELIRFDSTPVDESVFRIDNMPFSVADTKTKISVEQRMRRHWIIAGCWLTGSLIAARRCMARERARTWWGGG